MGNPSPAWRKLNRSVTRWRPAGCGTLTGIAYLVLYPAFGVALTALAAKLLGVVGSAPWPSALLVLGLLESLGVPAEWLSSHLAGSLHVLVRGGDPDQFLPAAA